MDNSVFHLLRNFCEIVILDEKLFSIFEDDVYKSKFLPKITFP